MWKWRYKNLVSSVIGLENFWDTDDDMLSAVGSELKWQSNLVLTWPTCVTLEYVIILSHELMKVQV